MTDVSLPASIALPEGQLTSLRPEWLLRHARQLAERTADTSVPQSVHARRSVSAAYYAVFHRVVINVAWSAVPAGQDSARWALCRTFGHGQIESVACWLRPVGKQKPPRSVAGLVALVAADPELRTFAERFIQLKSWRHDADYNHFEVFGRAGALLAYDAARTAIDALNMVYDDELIWRTFTSLVLLKSSVGDR